jgi:hypothetical protein
VLQGFAALVFDDWRFALQKLPIRFHAHCGAPDRAADDFGTGGRRWKPRPSGVGSLPPKSAVARFFRRCDWSILRERGLPRQRPHGLGGWGCLLVLRCDLIDLGFVEGEEEEEFPAATVWRADMETLPENISAVVLLDSPRGKGTLYRTHRGSSEVVLASVFKSSDTHPDPSFLAVRSAALDLLLDDLERMLT